MEATTSPPPAGWYTDPNDATTQRYWDGQQWTENRAPLEKKGAKPGVGSYIVAVLLPIVGVILAIVQFARGNGGQGAAVLLTSIVAFVIWFAVLAGMAASEYDRCIEDAQTWQQQLDC
jgi:Protein of unknown function (DUF2510)